MISQVSFLDGIQLSDVEWLLFPFIPYHESIDGLKQDLVIPFLYLFCPLKEGNTGLSID